MHLIFHSFVFFKRIYNYFYKLKEEGYLVLLSNFLGILVPMPPMHFVHKTSPEINDDILSYSYFQPCNCWWLVYCLLKTRSCGLTIITNYLQVHCTALHYIAARCRPVRKTLANNDTGKYTQLTVIDKRASSRYAPLMCLLTLNSLTPNKIVLIVIQP